MLEKRCPRSIVHKPHLWSRTTRRVVTEVTEGDTLKCPGSAKIGLRTEQDVRGEEIRRDAQSGTNWAGAVNYGPACLCGHPKKGKCYRHGTEEEADLRQ